VRCAGSSSRATADAASTYVWSWDGRRPAGVFVPNGTYTIRVRATNSLGTLTLRDTVRVIQVR